jgi:hypothetical protein
MMVPYNATPAIVVCTGTAHGGFIFLWAWCTFSVSQELAVMLAEEYGYCWAVEELWSEGVGV